MNTLSDFKINAEYALIIKESVKRKLLLGLNGMTYGQLQRNDLVKKNKYELFWGWQYYDGGHYWNNRIYANYSLSLVSAKERLKDAQNYLILEKDRSKKKKTPDKVVHGY